jgi:hypothetical protein
MRLVLVGALSLALSLQSMAEERRLKGFENSQSWTDFDQSLKRVEEREHTEAISYILSGVLVTLGGMAGASAASEPATKFIYGLSQSLGVAGIGYGAYRLNQGHSYSSFSQALRKTSLTPDQRDRLVSEFLKAEKEEQEALRRVRLYTYLALGTLNLVAAARETEASSKTMFQFFSGVNFALALSCTF